MWKIFNGIEVIIIISTVVVIGNHTLYSKSSTILFNSSSFHLWLLCHHKIYHICSFLSLSLSPQFLQIAAICRARDVCTFLCLLSNERINSYANAYTNTYLFTCRWTDPKICPFIYFIFIHWRCCCRWWWWWCFELMFLHFILCVYYTLCNMMMNCGAHHAEQRIWTTHFFHLFLLLPWNNKMNFCFCFFLSLS